MYDYLIVLYSLWAGAMVLAHICAPRQRHSGRVKAVLEERAGFGENG
jgi:hypothetical protein